MRRQEDTGGRVRLVDRLLPGAVPEGAQALGAVRGEVEVDRPDEKTVAERAAEPAHGEVDAAGDQPSVAAVRDALRAAEGLADRLQRGADGPVGVPGQPEGGPAVLVHVVVAPPGVAVQHLEGQSFGDLPVADVPRRHDRDAAGRRGAGPGLLVAQGDGEEGDPGLQEVVVPDRVRGPGLRRQPVGVGEVEVAHDARPVARVGGLERGPAQAVTGAEQGGRVEHVGHEGVPVDAGPGDRVARQDRDGQPQPPMGPAETLLGGEQVLGGQFQRGRGHRPGVGDRGMDVVLPVPSGGDRRAVGVRGQFGQPGPAEQPEQEDLCLHVQRVQPDHRVGTVAQPVDDLAQGVSARSSCASAMSSRAWVR